MTTSWNRIGTATQARLSATRLELHYAAQLPAAVGQNLIEDEPDFGNHSLSWDSEIQSLVGPIVPGADFRAALSFEPPTLRLLDGKEGVLFELELKGSSMTEARASLAKAVAARTGEGRELALAAHELPDHPVAKGASFDFSDTESLAELASWYDVAASLLERVQNAHDNASPLRCWPHHFDLATLISLDPDLDPEKARSIGVGMSPGDGSYDEPYLYVTPWPYPEAKGLPDLPSGAWHTQGWVGAVYTRSALIKAELPESSVSTFLEAAIPAANGLLRH